MCIVRTKSPREGSIFGQATIEFSLEERKPIELKTYTSKGSGLLFMV